MAKHEHDQHDAHVHLGHDTAENGREYLKFTGVIAGIVLVTIFLAWARGFEVHRFMGDFMAVFFIVFATFKFVNLEMFSVTYQSYDIIAKRFPLWGYAFPFIEGVLGVAYLLFDQNNTLNIITMLITGTAAIGVFQELRNKSNIMCACLGNVIKLPLSKVSFIEDAAMFLMAAAMIIV
ncbi:MAG: hypothetical protein U5L95_04655 [Candidatus Saccharibacteria bacterium]|nr:hypothetical protein [Candidatus Saccharibacteria bacterium]